MGGVSERMWKGLVTGLLDAFVESSRIQGIAINLSSQKVSKILQVVMLIILCRRVTKAMTDKEVKFTHINKDREMLVVSAFVFVLISWHSQ